MLFKELIFVYSENHVKSINALCEHYQKCWLFKQVYMYRVYHLKCKQKQSCAKAQKLNQKHSTPVQTALMTLQSRPSWLQGRWSRQLRKTCKDANNLCLLAERVFTSPYILPLKSRYSS
jgi:hypothetical protein